LIRAIRVTAALILALIVCHVVVFGRDDARGKPVAQATQPATQDGQPSGDAIRKKRVSTRPANRKRQGGRKGRRKQDAAASAPSSQSAGGIEGPFLDAPSLTADFGEVWSGPSAKVSFKFRNTGNRTLEITNVKSTCGCTQAGAYSKSVEPGDEGHIPFTVKTVGLQGKLTKHVRVTTNDPHRPHFNLAVTGRIKPVITFEPKNAFTFGIVRPGQVITREVTVYSHIAEPIELTLEGADDSKAVRAAIKPIEEGRSWALTLTTNPPGTDGNRVVPITLKPSRADLPPRVFNASMFVKPLIRVEPPVVRIFTGATEGKAHVKLTADSAFQIKSIKCDDPQLRLDQPNRVSDASYAFNITAPAGYKPARTPVVALETDHAQQPKFDIPIEFATRKSDLVKARRNAPATQPKTARGKKSVPATQPKTARAKKTVPATQTSKS